jgi:gas vesicle protein
MGGQVKTFASLYKGVIVGWLVGTTAGLFYARRPGKELQEAIRNRGFELKDKAEHSLEDARQKAEHLARTTTNRATELTQQGQALWREQKVSLLSAIQGVRTGVQVFAEQGGKNAATGTALQPASQHDLSTYVVDPGEIT